jgi:hypothetical protein
METKKFGSHPRPVITQTENNTTLWVGHLQTDPNDHFAGQTFKCPSAGTLDNIQVYSALVHYPGELTMTLHEFNPGSKTWGSAISNSTQVLHRNDQAKWVRFALDPVHLNKDGFYGFRLQTKDALIGIGEAATGTNDPFLFGHEWSGDSKNQQGHFFSYFSLAFKVELCA